MRIFIAGIATETNMFSPIPTGLTKTNLNSFSLKVEAIFIQVIIEFLLQKEAFLFRICKYTEF